MLHLGICVPKANRPYHHLFWLGILSLVCAVSLSQSLRSLPEARISIPLWKALDSAIALPHEFVVAGSESLIVSPGHLLRRPDDYFLDSRHGILRLTPDSALVGQARADSLRMLRISYRYIPFTFAREYSRNTVVVVRDTLRGDSVRVVRPARRRCTGP